MPQPTADELFTQLTRYSVIVCQRCQHAVYPTQVIAHLTSTRHRLGVGHARQIQAVVQQWDGISQDILERSFPTQVQKPIIGLQVYTDGILCTHVDRCGYVCRSKESIRKHWRTKHNWTPFHHKGHQSPDESQAAQDAIQGAMKAVSCQRFFVHGAASHYIYIRQPSPNYEPIVPPPRADVVDELMQQLEQTYTDSQASDNHTIQAGPLDEANPWLRRTQWATYLQGAY